MLGYDKDNQWLKELIGKSLTSKNKDTARSYMKDQQMSFYGGHLPSLKETCLITNQKNDMITDIGASCVDDLILDNFGNLLRWLMNKPTGAEIEPNFTNSAGVAKPVRLYTTGGHFLNYTWGNTGGLVQVGSGSTAPARTDFAIETAFASSPESGLNANFSAGWNSSEGKAIFGQIIFSGGSGIVSEAGAFCNWVVGDEAIVYSFMMMHDSISPTVSFGAGDPLSIIYELSS